MKLRIDQFQWQHLTFVPNASYFCGMSHALKYVSFAAAVILISCSGEKIRTPKILPFYGPSTDGSETPLHYEDAYAIPDFSFTDQHGKPIRKNDLEGKICVSNFFFATCQGICPRMNAQLKRVYDQYKDDPDLVILSHTVDPERDSASVLSDYAKKLGVEGQSWHFVTGNKEQLYDQAINGYYLPVSEGTRKGRRFIHSDKMALLDVNQHIRGYYTGTDSLEIDELIRAIMLLKNEKNMTRDYLDSLISLQNKSVDVIKVQ